MDGRPSKHRCRGGKPELCLIAVPDERSSPVGGVMAQTFVTGGSGFIGRALVRRLLAEGHEVRALVRSDASAAAVTALGAEPVRGELTDAASWQDGLRGSEVL